jgi:hypothetical protein
MTVLRVDAWQLKPLREQEMINLVTDLRAQIAHFGGRNVHLIALGHGADQAREYVTTVEWESAAAYGREFVDRADQDTEWMALVERALSDDAPASYLGSQLTTELALNGPRQELAAGMVAITRGWQVTPGQLPAFLQLARDVSPAVERLGGSTIIYQNTAGGMNPVQVYSVGLFPTMEACGTYLDAIGTDQHLQQLWVQAMGPAAPASLVFTRIDFVVA